METLRTEWRERAALDRAARVWRLRVGLTVRDALRLGQAYCIELTRSQFASPPQLIDLGIQLVALFDDMLVQVVTASTEPCAARLQDHDVLVAVDKAELLLSPPRDATHVHALIEGLVEANDNVLLRFARPECVAKPEWTAIRGVLGELDRLADEQERLESDYDPLARRCVGIATQELAEVRRLLLFGMEIVQRMRTAILDDEQVRFALRAQRWREAMLASLCSDCDDSGNEDDAGGGLLTPKPERQVRPLLVETAALEVDDTSQFLRALLDPAQSLEDTIDQLGVTIQSMDSLAAMSSELALAPSVQLYRDVRPEQTRDDKLQFRARVRVLRWTCERVASTNRAAMGDALAALRAEIVEFRRLFGGLLDRLRDECGFPRPPRPLLADRLALNVVIAQGMTINDKRKRYREADGVVDKWKATATLDGLPLADDTSIAQADARAGAASKAIALFRELVTLKISHVQPATAGADEARPSRQTRDAEPPSFCDVQARDATAVVDRKRSLEQLNEPPPLPRPVVRRRVEPDPPAVPAMVLSRTTVQDARSEEKAMKAEADAYVDLLKRVFPTPAAVKAKLESLEWDAQLAERTTPFTPHLSVTQAVSTLGGIFVCTVATLAGRVNFTNSDASLERAAQGVTRKLAEWVAGVHRDWASLADVYATIKKRKLRQQQHNRASSGDVTLSAATETRRDKRVSGFLDERAAARTGSAYHYHILVRGPLAVRRWAYKEKDAKRFASEAFRDLLEWILKTRAR